MQFYIINKDPKLNAKFIPDYALKQVNVREGYQMLCDIGHNLGVTWSGQNKPYSIWHAETRRHMVNREALASFIEHYQACLNEYRVRFGRNSAYLKKFNSIPVDVIRELVNKVPVERTHEEFVLEYLLTAKKHKMSLSDHQNLLKYKSSNSIKKGRWP